MVTVVSEHRYSATNVSNGGLFPASRKGNEILFRVTLFFAAYHYLDVYTILYNLSGSDIVTGDCGLCEVGAEVEAAFIDAFA